MYELELEDWEYKTTFQLDQLPDTEVQEIVFEGLDTHAEVYLNEQLVI